MRFAFPAKVTCLAMSKVSTSHCLVAGACMEPQVCRLAQGMEGQANFCTKGFEHAAGDAACMEPQVGLSRACCLAHMVAPGPSRPGIQDGRAAWLPGDDHRPDVRACLQVRLCDPASGAFSHTLSGHRCGIAFLAYGNQSTVPTLARNGLDAYLP